MDFFIPSDVLQLIAAYSDEITICRWGIVSKDLKSQIWRRYFCRKIDFCRLALYLIRGDAATQNKAFDTILDGLLESKSLETINIDYRPSQILLRPRSIQRLILSIPRLKHRISVLSWTLIDSEAFSHEDALLETSLGFGFLKGDEIFRVFSHDMPLLRRLTLKKLTELPQSTFGAFMANLTPGRFPNLTCLEFECDKWEQLHTFIDRNALKRKLGEFGGRITRLGFRFAEGRLQDRPITETVFMGPGMWNVFTNRAKWEDIQQQFRNDTGGCSFDIIRVNHLTAFGHAMHWPLGMQKIGRIFLDVYPPLSESKAIAEFHTDRLDRSRQIASDLIPLIRRMEIGNPDEYRGDEMKGWLLSVLDAQLDNAIFNQVSNDFVENNIVAAVLSLSCLSNPPALDIARLRKCLDVDSLNWITVMWFLARLQQQTRLDLVLQMKKEIDASWFETNLSRLDAAVANSVRQLLT